MKVEKRFLCLLLALLMVFGLTMTAFALEQEEEAYGDAIGVDPSDKHWRAAQ